MPSLLKQAGNFIKSAAQHVAAGLPIASDEEVSRRLNICGQCEFFTETKRCSQCGCGMELKARWAEQRCPLGKWELTVVNEEPVYLSNGHLTEHSDNVSIN